MSKIYDVIVPFTGCFTFRVSADSEVHAKQHALEEASELYVSPPKRPEGMEYPDTLDVMDFSVHKQIVQGNVFHGSHNEISAEDSGETTDEEGDEEGDDDDDDDESPSTETDVGGEG